uniref:Uncharacterized protein n=1 Tax=Pseudomonas graminis TaxID=158627 RepID=A0A7C2BBN1_9PSED
MDANKVDQATIDKPYVVGKNPLDKISATEKFKVEVLTNQIHIGGVVLCLMRENGTVASSDPVYTPGNWAGERPVRIPSEYVTLRPGLVSGEVLTARFIYAEYAKDGVDQHAGTKSATVKSAGQKKFEAEIEDFRKTGNISAFRSSFRFEGESYTVA